MPITTASTVAMIEMPIEFTSALVKMSSEKICA